MIGLSVCREFPATESQHLLREPDRRYIHGPVKISKFYVNKVQSVIYPFLTGCMRRTYAAIFSFIAGVMPLKTWDTLTRLTESVSFEARSSA